MNIAIHAKEPIVAQVRAYIEYRMFSAMSRFGRRVARLSVRLDSTQVGNRYCCTVTLDLTPAGRVRVRATADHLYAAVDQSAERLSRRVERRLREGEPRTRPYREDMMMHSLPPLPYTLDALAPHISAETLEYHWGKHHRSYVDTLNRLIAGTPLADLSLEELVRRSSAAVFNSAGQHFNHSLYWSSLSPNGGGEPQGDLAKAIREYFGSFASLRTAFTEQAISHFGSGWAWVVRKPDGTVRVEATHDAGCPLTSGDTPLLACDLWEHAYYIDHRNLRPRYLDSFWKVANWEFAEHAFEAAVQAPGVAATEPWKTPTSAGGMSR